MKHPCVQSAAGGHTLPLIIAADTNQIHKTHTGRGPARECQVTPEGTP
jgi:hypothetical protein